MASFNVLATKIQIKSDSPKRIVAIVYTIVTIRLGESDVGHCKMLAGKVGQSLLILELPLEQLYSRNTNSPFRWF